MAKIALGLDFGTLSVRALAVDVSDGSERGAASFAYPHGVMDKELATPSGEKIPLPPNWALQSPRDYLDALSAVVPAVLSDAGAGPADVVGIAADFTTCTLLPTDESGTPLCFDPRFENDPHAWVKLWKHHAAQPYADRINEIAAERGEAWLERYGGKVSSEWMFPKILETLAESPAVYDTAYTFLDAADWIAWILTGNLARNSCIAGYKALYCGSYPTEDFFAALDPRLCHVVRDKLAGPVLPVGSPAGGLTEEGARLTGLLPGTPVAVGHTDAHVAAPALGITKPGEMLALVGTSTTMLVTAAEYRPVPGVCGIVKDGILPGFWGYEAGLGCVGDAFGWFADNCVSPDLVREADRRGVPVIALLTEKIGALSPGESGVLALNWWNGNRNPLGDGDLSGMLLGLTLGTTSVGMFRALVESTAFGMRLIIENLREHGVPVDRFTASGGIPFKAPEIMQIYADALGMEIGIAGTKEGPAKGSAVYAAAAAGPDRGGYSSLSEAAERMGAKPRRSYLPDPSKREAYDALYREYLELVDYFGRGGNGVMKRLLAMKKAAKRK